MEAKKIIDEVKLKKKRHNLERERISEKMKEKMLNKKSKKLPEEEFLTAPKVIKDYREKQKSYINFKRKVNFFEYFFTKLFKILT